ncbi:SRPBCC family protein [Nocardiopsis alborubida]|uniref:SRPBCC family protein n=1 Tax=Nocardiopsis alborubida TaxID=146802 RepID=A0A7X6MAG7_9ACTN|nr:SRPBCC family protein [Nocardiopsis alborubida]NKY97202.1 SRPBCC family protein [Nocardiopsis alborubida]
MAYGEARLVMEQSPREIIEFVLDLHEYQKVDDKLAKVYRVERDGDEVVFRFRPRLMGLPGPVTTQRVAVNAAGDRIDVSGLPSWTDSFVRFHAFFHFSDVDEGTLVHRRVEFRFSPPMSWLMDRAVGRWLARDVPRELHNAREYLRNGSTSR